MTTATQAAPDEATLTALTDEIRAYVQSDGERWAQRIESERRVPMELWDELRERGYLRLAAPVQYGGRGIPFTRYLPLLELFAMSHASLRMIVHVCNGIWRPHRADRRHRRRPARVGRARG
jgi:alkylation response protein AidB-like acyl-CoA dehydrogenase